MNDIHQPIICIISRSGIPKIPKLFQQIKIVLFVASIVQKSKVDMHDIYYQYLLAYDIPQSINHSSVINIHTIKP